MMADWTSELETRKEERKVLGGYDCRSIQGLHRPQRLCWEGSS